jgi:hypothetical protein
MPRAAGGVPVQARGHDFPGQQDGHAIPYGTSDADAITGFVNAATDHSTAPQRSRRNRPAAAAHHGRVTRHKLDLISERLYLRKSYPDATTLQKRGSCAAGGAGVAYDCFRRQRPGWADGSGMPALGCPSSELLRSAASGVPRDAGIRASERELEGIEMCVPRDGGHRRACGGLICPVTAILTRANAEAGWDGHVASQSEGGESARD